MRLLLLTVHTTAGLRTLNLRQNILQDASSLNSAEFKTSLVDLELRDNLLKEVCGCVCERGGVGRQGDY